MNISAKEESPDELVLLREKPWRISIDNSAAAYRKKQFDSKSEDPSECGLVSHFLRSLIRRNWIVAFLRGKVITPNMRKFGLGRKSSLYRLVLSVLCAFLVALPVAARATNNIESVTGSIQNGKEVIKIDLSEPIAGIPSGFVVSEPARIALDFPEVGNLAGRGKIELDMGNVRSAQIAQGNERSRVIINLKLATNYNAQIQGKSLLITLDPPAQAATSGVATAIFAESRNREDLPLKGIDFKRGADNSGRVIVDLANNGVGVNVRQKGQAVVVEFLKSTLPEGMQRKLDVSDFGTPIQTVATSQIGDRVQMVIEPKGVWEHSAYQTDNQFVLEVQSQKVDRSKLTQGPDYSGEKLSLNFQNIEIRSLLQVIADFSNFNIITSDSVSGAVTLRLKEVPWDQALEIILQSKNLGMKKNGNVLSIAPKDEIAARDKQEFESKNTQYNIEPLKTQDFKLNYAKAGDVSTAILGGGAGATKILSNRGSIISEPRTNQLFVTDIPSKLEQVQALIAKLDIPVRQVLIEARIVEATEEFGKSLGVRLGGQPFNQTNSNSYFGGSYAAATAGGVAPGSPASLNAGSQFVNMPAVGQNGFNPGNFALSLFNAAKTRFINLEISAAESDGRGKTVASPRIVTADQVKALIEQGTELPYQMATSSGATAVAFRKASLKLEVTPQITPEGNIILNVDVNKDTVGRTTANGLAIDTKHVQTQVLVESGGTVVIGGIFTQDDREDVTKVPGLAELPVLGPLFKQTTRKSNRSELLVFITPRTLTTTPMR